ncbi:MAG: preprotein translocase subunit SecE [Gaiellaceae bacterium MAG52_C11]|nr:preprotein translocase subunit SecE [Candidatus Gaiellasilicea maunaloa]
MARETRGQRRAKRAAAGKKSGESAKPASANAGSSKAGAAKTGTSKPVSQRARQRQAQVRPGLQPAATQTGRRERRARGTFVKESWAELKKVEWPNRGQVIQGTIVVIIACVIVGVFLYGADQALKPFVRNVLLGQ